MNIGNLKTSRVRRSGAILAIAMALAAGASAEGTRQSPINIDKRDVAEAYHRPKITATYLSHATLTVVNTFNPNRTPLVDKEWATLKATPAGSSYVMVGNQQYDLLQFHFHTPSEHKINGKGAPMEVHFVHLKTGALPCDPEALLVIGAMIKQDSAPHKELSKIFNAHNLPDDSTQSAVTITNFDLNKVLPKLDDSFRYSGSLTAPSTFTNCTAQGGSIDDQLSADIFPENVQWVVLSKKIEMSKGQIKTFRSLFEEGNSRETQPLNGRSIYHVQH
jgi:carbonic anhydrase